MGDDHFTTGEPLPPPRDPKPVETSSQEHRRPWRVAFCITELDPGGAERQLVRLATGLDRTAFSAEVICLAGRGELVAPLEAAGIPVTCLHAHGRRDLSVIWRLWQHLRRTQPDLVQTFLFHANLAGRIAARAAGVPVVVSGLRVAERRSRWPLRLDRWTDRLVDRHVCVSRCVATFAAQTAGLPPRKLVVIPNGVEFDRYALAEPLPPASLLLPPGARFVLFAGRLEEQKDPLRLVDAFCLVSPKRPELHLLLAGEGPLRPELEQRAAATKGRIRLLGQRNDLPALMRSAVCLALTSRWEGMPNVVAEAMAAGLPVVATDVEGVTELLDGGRLGRIVHQPGAEAVAAALADVLDDPRTAAEQADAAQRHSKEHLTHEGTVSAYAELYRDLLESRRRVR